jgi:hypothetical protein
MHVVDANGREVGRVEYVQMGDPEAVTTEGQGEPYRRWPVVLGDALADEFDEPDVPEPLRSQLLRYGFVKIDGPGPEWFDTDLYVRADAIAEVSGDTVKLTVPKERLIKEDGDDDTRPVPAGALWWLSNPSD